MQLFRVGNRTCIVSYSYFRKLHLCTLVFLYLFFRRKITEIDRAVIPSEVVRLESYPPQFPKFGHVPPAPLPKTMIEKNKIMILCSICTLIFVSGGRGMPGLTCASSGVQEVVVWTAFTPSFRRVYFWARKKSRKIRHANTGLPSSRFLPRMLFVLK